LKPSRKKTLKLALATTALLIGGPLVAQTTTTPAKPAAKTGASTTMPKPATPTPTPSPATPAAATSYTEEELKQFAAAAIEVTKLQSDAAVPAADKQAKMLAVLQAKGIDPARFNAIGQAAAADPALQQRIQAAANASAASAPATPAAPATAATPAAPATPGAAAMPATPATPAQPAQ
jgi:hypothetical protein